MMEAAGSRFRIRLRQIIAFLVIIAVVFLAVTIVALEGGDVVVLRSFTADSRARATRTWIAEEDGYQWIEAANPDRPFLDDVKETHVVELEHGSDVVQCNAEPEPNPAGHTRIRRLLAAKYGWADGWIGLLTDTSESVAVRLECEG